MGHGHNLRKFHVTGAWLSPLVTGGWLSQLASNLTFLLLPDRSLFCHIVYHLLDLICLIIGVQQGMANSLKFHAGPPCPSLLHPVGEQPLKRPYSRFRGSPPPGWAACGSLLPHWTPHALHPCCLIILSQ
jgi:hypothetical protein